MEADDSYGHDRVEDLNTLLQSALDHTQTTLRLLAVRLGLPYALAADTLQRFPLMQQLATVVRDGALVVGEPLWAAGAGSLTLQRNAVSIASWLHNGACRRNVG